MGWRACTDNENNPDAQISRKRKEKKKKQMEEPPERSVLEYLKANWKSVGKQMV